MHRITVIGDIQLNDSQLTRLKNIGQVTLTKNTSLKAWRKSVQDATIICCDHRSYLLNSIYTLKDVFITYPFIEIGDFSSKRLRERGVLIANAKGANRASVVEWSMFMILSLLRGFLNVVNPGRTLQPMFTQSLQDKQVLIIGKGDIGTHIGNACTAFGMNVDYVTRTDNPNHKAKDADVILNCLNCNSTSHKLLGKAFFLACKPGAYFISFAMPYTYSIPDLVHALHNNKLAGAAIDFAETPYGDVTHPDYKVLADAPNMIITPHTAFATRQTLRNGVEIMLQNVEAYVSGQPQNIICK